MAENFNFLRILLTSIGSSSIFFIGIAVFVLSGGLNGGAFVTFSSPIIRSTMIGAGLGILHGLAMSLFLIWGRSVSIFLVIPASIVAMEIISLCLCFLLWLWNQLYTTNNRGTDYFNLAFGYTKFFLYVSAFLLAPAIIIGLTNWLCLIYFRNR